MKKQFRITKELVIAARALRCPMRVEDGVFTHCGGEHPSNCNPRLCTYCTDIIKDMYKIANGEIKNPLE